MKKTFLTLMLLFIANLSIAQDASNDATWEETIDFISENISLFDRTIKTSRGTAKLDLQVEFRVENVSLKATLTNKYLQNILCGRLKDIKNVELVNDAETGEVAIKIVFLDNTVSVESNNGKSTQSLIGIPLYSKVDLGSNEYWLGSDGFDVTDEIVKRMYKAFQHLTYLAGEKRKQSKF